MEQSNRVIGEYIVTVSSGTDAESLRRLYAAYGVRDVADLGGGYFLVKLKLDPGLAEIRRLGLESGKIRDAQPNFVYRSNRP